MNEPRRTFDERLKAISGTLGVLIGLLALVPQFSKNISEAVDAVIKLPQIVWYLVPVLLLIVGMFALRDGLARRSRLLRPEALILKADHPEHLKGREEDIDRLSALCDEYQQVNLVGESGAGKSALIQAGLCPRLKAEPGLFPIYLNVWGQDWELGPRTALVLALWEAFSNEDRQTLGRTGPPKPEHLVSMFEHVRVRLGRTPLLIFDQFDDYQTRHRSQFLAGRRRTWLPANRLITANSFWRDIKEAIDNHTVHCLFATRADAADGLESIRFVAPQVYRLDRLNADFVLPLLTELTAHAEDAAPVVFAPDRGWERLKERLARDLSEDGAVLPVQMKIALQGLASLKSPTVRDYERAGGLQGLEAAHVERHIVNTALHSGLTKIQVQTLLTFLADTKTLKTVPRLADDVAAAITAGDEIHAGRIRKAVEEALDDLEKKEIIRKRLDPDTRQHVWILDHDYLCRGVLEAERLANRWLALAQERYRAFRDAGSSTWRKWRSLLSPWQQIVLLTQRVRGRFRYGPLRSYATWSLLRFVPYLLMLAVVVYGQIAIRQWQQAGLDRAKAHQIRSAIGLQENLSPTEIDHLWELANSQDAVRYSVLEQALELPATAEQFNRRAEMAVHAVVGLDHHRRQNVLKNILLPKVKRSPADPNILVACFKIGTALLVENEYPEFSLFAVNMLIETIEKTTDVWQLSALMAALREAVRKLVPAEAQQVFTHLLATIEKTTDMLRAGVLDDALQATAERLTPVQVSKVFMQLLAVIEKTTVSHRRGLSEVVKTVAGKLASVEEQEAFIQLLAVIAKTTSFPHLRGLAETLQAEPGELAPTEVQKVSAQLITAIENTTDAWQLSRLAEALKFLPGEVAPAEVQKVSAQLITAMENTTDPWQLSALAEALKFLPGEVATVEAQKVFIRLITAIEKPSDRSDLLGHLLLARALEVVAGKLTSAEAPEMLTQLLSAIVQTTASPWLVARAEFEALSEALKVVAGKLTSAQAPKVFTQLLSAVVKSTNSQQFVALAQALKVVAGKITSAQAPEVFTQLLSAIVKSTNSQELGALAQALQALPVELAPADAQMVSVRLITAIKKSIYHHQIEALGEALKAVPHTLDSQQVINLLKWPVSVGVLRSTFLDMLERQTGQKFDRDLWKMAAWAQQNGFDVKSPPKRLEKGAL